VVVEPVVGEGGNVLADAYLHRLAGFCRENGIYFIIDEVTTGMGRTGAFTRTALATDGVLENVKHQGSSLHTGLSAVAARHRQVSAVRGTGLMYAVEVCGAGGEPADLEVASCPRLAMEDRGVLVSALATRPAIMIIPPLVISTEDADEIITALDGALDEVRP
jgi:4-aminobutyrate aminotransferase-like enzyme